jgi:hypothetical protein
VIGQYPCAVKLNLFHVVGLAPFFAAMFQGYGNRFAFLGATAAAVATVLEAFAICLGLASASCGGHGEKEVLDDVVSVVCCNEWMASRHEDSSIHQPNDVTRHTKP